MTEQRSAAAWGIRLARLWRDLAGRPYPINVKEFAIEYSVQTSPSAPIGEIREVNLAGFEGGLFWLPNKKHWVLLYQANPDLEGRTNYTLAHEFGHFVLHRDRQEKFECSSDNVLGQDVDGLNIENEADVFASYLLMPADEIRKFILGKSVDLDLLGSIAKQYKVSLMAATRKWLEVTTECAVLVVARSDFVKWYHPSKSAKPFAYRNFAPGTPLPLQSHAALGYAGLSASARKQGVDFGSHTWVPELCGREMGIVSDRYDLTISLLIFEKPMISRGAEPDEDDEQQDSWEPPRFK